MNSDSSSELILSHLLAQQNAVMSTDWYYSTELRAIHSNLVFAPLFKVFSNWHTVRLVGMIIMQVLFLLSYWYLCKQAQFSRQAFFYSGAILMLPFSVQYGQIVLYHSFYITCVTISFLIVGFNLSVIRQWSRPEKKRMRWITLLMLLLTCFLSGLNGVRQLMITLAPMFLSAFLLTLKIEKNMVRPDRRSVWEQWRWVIVGAAACCAGVIGYLINEKVLANIYSYRSYGATTTDFITYDNFINMMKYFFSQFGYQTGREVFSLEGLLACGSVLAAFYIIVKGLALLFSHKIDVKTTEDETAVGAFIDILAPVSILTMFFTFIFLKAQPYYFLYFIPVIIWIVPFLARQMDVTKTANVTQKALLFLTCAVLIGNGYYDNAYFIHPDNKKVIYEGLGRKDIHTVQELQGAVDFLQENQYTLGYASYWCSNVVTEMTNGEIPMVNVQVNTKNPAIAYYNWLTDKRYRDYSFVEGKKVFLLLPLNENDAFLSTPMADTASEVYQDELYVIYDFEYSDDPWNALNEA
ncbi:MAG TPA: hypothetical protein PKN45_10370 [Candidatus Limiplasma sp.]|nr:hypothetical protein [Candidatus Limiplasma sp.]